MHSTYSNDTRKKKHEPIQPSKLDPNKAAAEAIKRQLLGLDKPNHGVRDTSVTARPMSGTHLLKKRKVEVMEQRRLHHVNNNNSNNANRSNNYNSKHFTNTNNNNKLNHLMASKFHKEGETFDTMSSTNN